MCSSMYMQKYVLVYDMILLSQESRNGAATPHVLTRRYRLHTAKAPLMFCITCVVLVAYQAFRLIFML